MSDKISRYEAKIDEAVRRVLEGEQPGTLFEPARYILELGGKRLRPLLVLLSVDLFEGDTTMALYPAVAIEVFHNFSLVHDDLMDRAAIRRGHPTVHEKWNANVAVLSGDAMVFEAYKQLARVPSKLLPAVLELFSTTAMEVCKGQQYDMDFEGRDQVTEGEYLDMIRLKTGVLIGCSLKMGAILAETSPGNANALYDFGMNMGLAFQLKDDLLDVYGDPLTFGKRIGGDILCNKKTYLLIKALENARNDLNQANSELSKVMDKWLELERHDLTEKEHDLLLNSISAVVTAGQSPYDIEVIDQHLQTYRRASVSTREQLPLLQAELKSNASQLASLVEPLFSPSWRTSVAVGSDFQTVAALREELLVLTKHADALYIHLDIADDMSLSGVQASIIGALRALAEAIQAATYEQSASTDISMLTDHISELDKVVRVHLLQYINFRAAGEALTDLATELSLDSATKKSLDAISEEINAAFVRIHSPNEYEYVGDGEVLLRSRDSKKNWSLDQVSTGQRSAFALSVFLALNHTAVNAPPVVLIDDPIAHIDDLNALSFLDYLRDLAVHSKRQIFFATADTRIASLFARKFGFLGNDFKTISLVRDVEA